MAGPAMVAAWVADDSPAIVRGSAAGGTMAGGIVCEAVVSNERAAPSANTTARISPVLTVPVAVATARTTTAHASPPWASRRMVLRS